MQCTSYIPVYHARDINISSSGFSWRPFNSNANYEEKKGYDISLPPHNREQYVGYDKEVLKQIMQNHDATFRYQVQELHRLYRRQKELMDEMSVRKIFTQRLLSQTSEAIHSLSHARSGISQAASHATTNWLLGDHSHSNLSELTTDNIQQPPNFIVSNYFQKHLSVHTGPFIKKNSYNEVKFLSSRNENRIFNLELPADVYCGDEKNQFTQRNISEAHELTCNSPEELPDIKSRDLSKSNLNNKKLHCLIDLNEPIHIESLPSSTMCPMEIMCDDPCISVEAVPKSVVPKDSGLLNRDDSSDGSNYSVAIDLNSMPDGFFSEMQVNFENIRTIKKEITEGVDNHPFVDTKIDDNKLMKTETDIDLNNDVVLNEPSPSQPLSSLIFQLKDRNLEGPTSPENEECSPPRGKSEEIQPSAELEIVAAKALVTISFCGAHGYTKTDMSEPPMMNSINCLSWFVEIISSTGDDVENKITKLQNDSHDHGELLNVSEEKNDLDFSRVVEKVKETGNSSVRSQKGHARGTKRRVLPSHSKGVGEIEGFLKKRGKKTCAKSRKYSKLSSDRVKKSMWSILKQPGTRSEHGILPSWGNIRKREGGLRRKASKFLVIN